MFFFPIFYAVVNLRDLNWVPSSGKSHNSMLSDHTLHHEILDASLNKHLCYVAVRCFSGHILIHSHTSGVQIKKCSIILKCHSVSLSILSFLVELLEDPLSNFSWKFIGSFYQQENACNVRVIFYFIVVLVNSQSLLVIKDIFRCKWVF